MNYGYTKKRYFYLLSVVHLPVNRRIRHYRIYHRVIQSTSRHKLCLADIANDVKPEFGISTRL